ncbi:MAG: anthranilate phosphoribosyltransferase [Bacteroidota bacterium]
MKSILTQLINQQPLSRTEAKELMHNIAEENYSDVEIGAFLTTYLMRTITVDELAGYRDALIELAVKINLEVDNAIDIVGTGGDGKNTFNISTLSTFVVAGAGYKVIKHGNYGASSVSGSSNVLEYLGYQFTNNNDALQEQLDKNNICFLHAPLFHPAMKAVGPARKSLKMKTIFNLLGPLVNPASPSHQLVGVYDLHIARLYQFFLQKMDRSYLIAHALDGYDEISLTSPAKVIGNGLDTIFKSDDFGLDSYSQEELHGGDSIKDAAKIFINVLNQEGTNAQEDVILANAGLAIQCMEPDKPLPECVEIARESLQSGKALDVLKQAVE